MTRTTPAERAYLDERLRARVLEAWELRGSPYILDAAAAIAAAHEREQLTLFERREERSARLVRVMRATDPARIVRERAA